MVSLVLVFTLFATVALAALPPVRREISPTAVRPPEEYDRLDSPLTNLRAEGQREHGQPIGKRTILQGGESIVVTAHGFRPGEQVSIRLGAPGHTASADSADDSGSVRFVYRIPANLRTGQHHIIIKEAQPASGGSSDIVAIEATSRQSGPKATAVKSRFALLAFVTD